MAPVGEEIAGKTFTTELAMPLVRHTTGMKVCFFLLAKESLRPLRLCGSFFYVWAGTQRPGIAVADGKAMFPPRGMHWRLIRPALPGRIRRMVHFHAYTILSLACMSSVEGAP
jgi:hypothetical protein